MLRVVRMVEAGKERWVVGDRDTEGGVTDAGSVESVVKSVGLGVGGVLPTWLKVTKMVGADGKEHWFIAAPTALAKGAEGEAVGGKAGEDE